MIPLIIIINENSAYSVNADIFNYAGKTLQIFHYLYHIDIEEYEAEATFSMN